MKNIFLFFFGLSSLICSAQQGKWDSTFRPGSYDLKVELFRSFPDDSSDIVFAGNSITAGVDWMELLGNTKVRNRGISGDISFGLLERLDEITSGKPAKIFILIGINDISRNIPDSLIIKNYRKIIQRIKTESPATQIYFHTLMPVNNEFTQFKNHYNKDKHISFVNEELYKLGAEEKITVIDLHAYFMDKQNGGKLNKAYTQDGLHLNAAGYKLWAEILKGGRYLMPELTFDFQGHRGARGLMPENTIPAMLKAIDLGVTTLELDVVISSDSQVVVSHDPYFHHNITTKPNGQLLAKGEGEKHLIFSMTYDSISKYDVGKKVHPDYPRQEKISVSKPLLSELIKRSEMYAAALGKAMFYNIEIKSKKEGDDKRHPGIESFADLVVAQVKKSGVSDRTTIQSFDPRALQVMHRKYPEMVLSYLMEPTEKKSLLDQINELGFIPDVYSPHFSLVTKELVDSCHKFKMKIIPWTVNDLQSMKRLMDLGVDGLISDYPDLYKKLQ